jgi:histidine triad (HIT) family protein
MSTPPSCIFCAIAAGQAPAHVVAQNQLALCILDIQPLAAGHCLVIPRRHVPWWHQLTEAEVTGVYGLARVVALRLMEVYRPEFVCQYVRGRRVAHTHLFLVPTQAGDPLDRVFNALEGLQESPRRLAQLAEPAALAEAAAALCHLTATERGKSG